MIQNEYQYKLSQSKIKELQEESIELNKIKNDLHPRQFKIRQNGLQGMMDDILSDIAEYPLYITSYCFKVSIKMSN